MSFQYPKTVRECVDYSFQCLEKAKEQGFIYYFMECFDRSTKQCCLAGSIEVEHSYFDCIRYNERNYDIFWGIYFIARCNMEAAILNLNLNLTEEQTEKLMEIQNEYYPKQSHDELPPQEYFDSVMEIIGDCEV